MRHGEAQRSCRHLQGTGFLDQRRQIVIDGVTKRMPEAASPCRLEPLGDDPGGGWVLTQDEVADCRIADIGIVHGADQRP